MATLIDIKNQVHTIEKISEEVFKYEMEISHLHENSEYYIINYNKIYTKQGYNYILKNADGNYYWATPGTKNFIEDSHYPPEFEIKTYEYHKLIDKQGNTYLDENKNPILELEADFKKCNNKEYKEQIKQISKNKVVDDYYVSSYIYGLKYSLDTSQRLTTDTKINKDNEEPTGSKSLVPSPEEINEINKIYNYVNNIKFDVFLIYIGKSDEENENRLKELLKTNKEKLKKFIDKYKQATKGCSGNNENLECVYKASFSLAKIETLIEYVGDEK